MNRNTKTMSCSVNGLNAVEECSGVEFCDPTELKESFENESCVFSNNGFEKQCLSSNHLDNNTEYNTLLMSSLPSQSSITTPKHFTNITALKQKIMSRLPGKVCKECFYQSIYSQLSRLGIVKPSNIDVLENNKKNDDQCDDEAFPLQGDRNLDSCKKKSLLRSVSKRSLTEMDWYELTKFAEGELFDPNSATAQEILRVIEEGKDELSVAFKLMHNVDFEFVVEEAEKCVQCVLSTGWKVVSHWELPTWLRDNDFLWHMHRPQLPSFRECFSSMFRLHTETGNIWTHFVGFLLVIAAMLMLYTLPDKVIGDFPKDWEEYMVFSAFFIGAMTCLLFSWLYHTCSCHSKKTSSLFSKLDYTGIACMIMGSFVPCIYYGFYCNPYEKIAYLVSMMVLGICSIIVSLWDKFATPAFRPIRAGVFLALGCSGVIPVGHMLVKYGSKQALEQAAIGWLSIMGLCYIVGAILYALRIPERFFPGKCNLIFQSHQIFHILVVIAAFIHLHGCCEMALYRIKVGRNCSLSLELPIFNSTSFFVQ
ncbi:adiponectin receptor protein 1 isoform X3 [Hydra vulgaris]|uniref:Adiponectin receptor protein 1 isoform X3 n=1 Tax=Hydra vulgaris TaxID=6087 RepID=A0ABM4BDJ5_HYDVU